MDLAVKGSKKPKAAVKPVTVIKRVGVIGAGQMGSGIAHVVALGGFDVLINDIKSDAIDKALASIERNMQRQVGKGIIAGDEMNAALTRIKPATAVDQLADIRPPLVTCEAVLSEACFLLRDVPAGPTSVLRLVDAGMVVVPATLGANARRLADLIGRYASVPMSLADAFLVWMAEQGLGSAVLTLDDDFRVYRMHGRKVIPTILPPA